MPSSSIYHTYSCWQQVTTNENTICLRIISRRRWPRLRKDISSRPEKNERCAFWRSDWDWFKHFNNGDGSSWKNHCDDDVDDNDESDDDDEGKLEIDILSSSRAASVCPSPHAMCAQTCGATGELSPCPCLNNNYVNAFLWKARGPSFISSDMITRIWFCLHYHYTNRENSHHSYLWMNNTVFALAVICLYLKRHALRLDIQLPLCVNQINGQRGNENATIRCFNEV